MQLVDFRENGDRTMACQGLRVLLLSGEGEDGRIALRLADLGARLDVVDELFAGMSEVIDDPTGYALFVVECDSDGVGGLDAAQRAVQMLGAAMARVPVILISQDCRQQSFPSDRSHPIILRAPLSAVALKVGVEHALRDRMIYQAA